MRVAIIDNDREHTTLIEQYLHTYRQNHNLDIQVTRYESGEAFQAEFRHQFDMILLDVSLPGMDGVQAARILREKDTDVAILFITRLAQFAICGYEVDAMDFILKPVDYAAFAKSIHKALARVRKQQKRYLMVSDRNGSRRLAVEDIYYLESRGHALVYHTAAGSHIFRGTISEAEKLLAAHGFFRCNKGYLVSLRHVEGIRNGCALVNGTELLISRPRKAAFLQALTEYFERPTPA